MDLLADSALPDSGFIFARIVFFGISDFEEPTFFEATWISAIITGSLLYPFRNTQ
jgi:hypothetical protein